MLRTIPSSGPSSTASGRAAPQASARLAELRRRIDALERAGSGPMAGQRAAAAAVGALPFGAPEIDDALPWRGLAAGALHEVSGPARDAAALGFVSALLARLAARAPGAGHRQHSGIFQTLIAPHGSAPAPINRRAAGHPHIL